MMRDFLTAIGVIGLILIIAISVTVVSNGQNEKPAGPTKLAYANDVKGDTWLVFTMGSAMHAVREKTVTSMYLSRSDGTMRISAGGREIRTFLNPADFSKATQIYREQLADGTVPIMTDLKAVQDFFTD